MLIRKFVLEPGQKWRTGNSHYPKFVSRVLQEELSERSAEVKGGNVWLLVGINQFLDFGTGDKTFSEPGSVLMNPNRDFGILR